MTNLPATTEGHTAAVAAPGRVGQATAVEQSRAIAEVQAAVVVAQQMPRSITTARGEMQQSCGMLGLAEKAFFRYSRGGGAVTGASVYLARELARCWGNVQYGVAELRRDDEAGESEMQAWAWDVQTNARASTTFIVPHKRDKRGGPVAIVDLRDVYENNANMGARRLREMIFGILPVWFTEEAKDLCLATVEKGNGKPLEERIDGAIRAFDGLGVVQSRLELKLGRAADRWTAYDVAQLLTIHRSISRREVTVEDEFPQPRVTRDEVEGGGQQPQGPVAVAESTGPQPGAVDQRPPTQAMVKALTKALDMADEDCLAWASEKVGRPVTAFEDLTRQEVAALIDQVNPVDEDGGS